MTGSINWYHGSYLLFKTENGSECECKYSGEDIKPLKQKEITGLSLQKDLKV